MTDRVLGGIAGDVCFVTDEEVWREGRKGGREGEREKERGREGGRKRKVKIEAERREGKCGRRAVLNQPLSNQDAGILLIVSDDTYSPLAHATYKYMYVYCTCTVRVHVVHYACNCSCVHVYMYMYMYMYSTCTCTCTVHASSTGKQACTRTVHMYMHITMYVWSRPKGHSQPREL